MHISFEGLGIHSDIPVFFSNDILQDYVNYTMRDISGDYSYYYNRDGFSVFSIFNGIIARC